MAPSQGRVGSGSFCVHTCCGRATSCCRCANGGKQGSDTCVFATVADDVSRLPDVAVYVFTCRLPEAALAVAPLETSAPMASASWLLVSTWPFLAAALLARPCALWASIWACLASSLALATLALPAFVRPRLCASVLQRFGLVSLLGYIFK